ncbi:MAG: DUF5343 domain-containing protein [Gemmatimonadetes bacterium]|nr:DUF5343 domain-containing protein [Gemmatimonadota bacterium]
MGLANAYVLPTNRIGDILGKIRDGQAPERFTQQLLKDWGFGSTNDRAFIALFKALGFLTADGVPTQRYHDYRDHSRSKTVLAQALRDAYGDLFLIKEHPSSSDKAAIEGKFKSFHNVSDNVAGLMTKTFLGLLTHADLRAKATPAEVPPTVPPLKNEGKNDITGYVEKGATLHYNIQIHLPATKDVEVYNAIFKSLKEHLF